MAPAYKVTYFNITALGEPIRFLLSYGKIEFEDCRVEIEQWPQLKPSMPFGQLPVLEHNGKKIPQSLAICRYLAKQVKLAGNDDWENLEIDSIAEAVNDLRQNIGKYHYESDEKVKERERAILFNEKLPFFLEKLEDVAKQNNGHLALGRLTWADLYFVSLLDYMNFMLKKDLIENRPNLISVKNNVTNVPSIKEWLEKRPKTNL
ncbi:glutathione S-transferase isoform X2 [Coccinella septempunctata]|nr:glutathione S-transferase isoform X2 [Coccinella septempunctata]